MLLPEHGLLNIRLLRSASLRSLSNVAVTPPYIVNARTFGIQCERTLFITYCPTCQRLCILDQRSLK
jgi:hypothetical protein